MPSDVPEPLAGPLAVAATLPLWERLCALLDPDPELWPGVRAALLAAEPEEDEPDAGWLALIDGLDDAGALAYLEAGDGGMELEEALAELPRVSAAGLELEAVGDVGGTLAEAIAVADRLLVVVGLRTLHVPEDDGAHPLVVVAADSVAEIVELAGRLGHAVG